jgi:hypothetical protein
MSFQLGTALLEVTFPPKLMIIFYKAKMEVILDLRKQYETYWSFPKSFSSTPGIFAATPRLQRLAIRGKP